MTRNQGWTSVLLVVGLALGALAAAGCFSKAAARAEKTTNAPLPGAVPQRTLALKPVAKPAPRESAFSTYSNSEYGASFKYPRNYPLDEGPLDEETVENIRGLRSQGQLEGEQPGGVLGATIIVPDDSFPNTTFAGGSVQFAVNRYLAGQGCRELPASWLGDANGTTGTKIIQGVAFNWADSDAGEGETEFFERDYAGFANGTCYEFFLRAGVASAGDSEQAKPANQKKIVAQLEKIVGSLELRAPETSVLDGKGTGTGQRRR